MKTLLKSILIGLLIGNTALAGLPPTTTQSQLGTKQTTFNLQAPMNQFTALGGPNALIETGNANILKDPGFESGGTTGVTISGGAVATVNTAAKGTGSYGMDWDSNAAGQTATGVAITIPPGLKGKNAVVSCNVYTVSGTATHTLAAWDGTTAINPTTIASVAGQWIRTSVNIIAPSSGTITWQTKSVASNEPEIYVDDCLLEDAAFFNLSQVSQAQILGSVTITGCAGSWSVTSASFASFGAQTGCSYSTTDQAVADTTFGTAQLPAIKFASIPPGELMIQAEGAFASASSTQSFFQFYDGTNTSREQSELGNNVTNGVSWGGGVTQSIRYTTAQSNVTLQLRAKSVSNATTVAAPLVIKVYFFPSQSQTGYKPDQTPASWSGYQVGAGGGWSISGGAAYTDFPTATTSNTVTPTGTPINMTCVGESTKLPAITCTVPRGGNYKIKASGTYGGSGSSSLVAVQLTDGSNNIIDAGQGFNTVAGGANSGFALSGRFTASSAGSYTFKLRGYASASTTETMTQSTTFPITWEVIELDAPMPAPYLVGSVTSTTAGQLKHEYAIFSGSTSSWTSCTASPCSIYKQSGAFSTATRSAAGLYQVVFSGASDVGACHASAYNNGTTCQPDTTTPPTSTTYNFRCTTLGGTLTDVGFEVTCDVPR